MSSELNLCPDPLSLLRQYNIEKKEIIEENDQIIFGEYSFSKYVHTNFLEYCDVPGALKKYYTLEALLFCLKHESSSRKKYIKKALNADVPAVCRVHRRDLLAYLNGNISTCPNIDENVTWKIPAQDSKLPVKTLEELWGFNDEENSENNDQFPLEENSRIKCISPNISEADATEANQQKMAAIHEPAEFVESEDGSRKLVDGPYLFTEDKKIGNRTYWRCDCHILFQCPARITTNNDLIESKWRSHNHLKFVPTPTPYIETAVFENKTKMNSVGASDSEITKKNNANVCSVNLSKKELKKANAQHGNRKKGVKSKITRRYIESVSRFNRTDATSTRATNEDPLDIEEIAKKYLYKDYVRKMNSANMDVLIADVHGVNCSSAVQSETTKQDVEIINNLNDACSESKEASQDTNCLSASKSDMSKKDTEIVNSVNSSMVETVKANTVDVNSSSVESETANQDTRIIDDLNGAYSKTKEESQDASCLSASKSDMLKKDAETVGSVNSSIVETKKADIICSSTVKSETTKQDTEVINNLNGVCSKTKEASQDANCLIPSNSDMLKKDTETVRSVTSSIVQTMKVDVNCSSTVESETTKQDIEVINNLNDVYSKTKEASQDANCPSAAKSDMSKKDTETVSSVNSSIVETVKANTVDVCSSSTVKSATTKQDAEIINHLNGVGSKTKEASQDINYLSALKSDMSKKDTETVSSVNSFIVDTRKAITVDGNCSSTNKSETTKKDTESDNSTNGADVKTMKANQNALNLETTKKNTEMVSILNGALVETTNIEDVNSSNTKQSESEEEDTETSADSDENASTASVKDERPDNLELILSFSKLFNSLALKIVDGATDFHAEELFMISSVYSYFDKLMILRKFNEALDSAMKDLQAADVDEYLDEKFQSCAKKVDLSTESCDSDLSKASTPSKQLHSSVPASWEEREFEATDAVEEAADAVEEATDAVEEATDAVEEATYAIEEVTDAVEEAESDNSGSESSESDDEGSSNVKLSEKMTCICVICDKPIDIPPDADIQFIMEAHLHSLHPSRLEPLDSSSDSDEESSKSSEENKPADDPMILLDGTNVDDFEVKFDQENALKYVYHSNGIYNKRNRSNSKISSICAVCGSFIPLPKYVCFHLRSRGHREKVREYYEHSVEAKKNHVVPVDPDIFVICHGKLYCVECQVYLLNPHAFLSHVSEQHEQKLKLDFPVVNIGGVDFCSLCDCRKVKSHLETKRHYIEYLKVTTVVQLKSIKFCSLCHVKLFTESQYDSHVNDDSHISNLELINTLVHGLKFGKNSR